MKELLAGLIVYKNMNRGEILLSLAEIINDYKTARIGGSDLAYKKSAYINAIYEQVHLLLDLATEYGFDENLWQNYLAFIIATSENPFSVICEKAGAKEGSVNQFAKSDFSIFKKLFDYDFSDIEEELGINCFTTITNYKAIEKNTKRYNKSVSDKVRRLSRDINKAKDSNEIFEIVTNFYKTYGVGTLGLNKAFRIAYRFNDYKHREVILEPINNTDDIVLDDLIGYEIQKKKLIDNTESFINGKSANNVLLFGDSGTGKSSSVKAILNEYYERGLRMIEVYKHEFKDLSSVIAQVKNRNYKFIIFMDDLSFEEFETEYKYLKAVIEGGLEKKPDNVLIYATSNRRHLIRETWKDRSDMDDELHRSDTMQEKLSLASRFGVTINYSAPSYKEYIEIVKGIASSMGGLKIDDKDLEQQAKMWELSHGGVSGRTARQFINYLIGQGLIEA
ncbi:MAG: ATP-binding protein [Clostridiales bacterium]|nr:ATP-binding protein [Clostridiales bacterium]